MTNQTMRRPADAAPTKRVSKRWSTARRIVQLSILAAFALTARGWTILDRPVLAGDLSSSRFMDAVPLSDPLAFLERLFALHAPTMTSLTGFLVVTALYLVLGSRTFCGWVCPMNMVVEAAAFARTRLGLKADAVKLSRSLRYGVLAGVLAASALLQTAAFEAVSPQALIWRDVVYGSGLSALAAALLIFAVEVGISKNAWCGHICPLGAFWALVGKVQKRPLIRIRFDSESCTRCGDCLRACPEQQIIKFKELEKNPFIPTGECLNCGRCIESCPEASLKFSLGRSNARPEHKESATPGEQS